MSEASFVPGGIGPDPGIRRPVPGERRLQRVFARRLLLFLSPGLLVLGGAEAVLWMTRETWPVAMVINHQRTHPDALFLRRILDQAFYRYKFLNVQQRRPRILVLGSSRVMQFRGEMFASRNADFYNAGGMIQEIEDLRSFVGTLTPETTPEVALLGLDLWWFNPSRAAADGFTPNVTREAALDWQAHLRALRRLKSRKVFGPALGALFQAGDHIGMEARISDTGFRTDGSMRYSFPTPRDDAEWAYVDRERPPVIERIRGSSREFVACEGLAPERVGVLRDCLQSLAGRQVLVLGFLPPFSAECATLLASQPGQSNLWNEARIRLAQVFREAGQPFVDASVTANLSLDDRHLVDGMHAAETFHLHLLQAFLENPAVDARLPGLRRHLRSLLEAPGSNPWHPRYPGVAGDDGR